MTLRARQLAVQPLAPHCPRFNSVCIASALELCRSEAKARKSRRFIPTPGVQDLFVQLLLSAVKCQPRRLSLVLQFLKDSIQAGLRFRHVGSKLEGF